MAGARGFVTGVVSLSLLEAFLTSKGAPSGLAGGTQLIARGLGRWLDPTIPLIPIVKHPPAAAVYTTPPPSAGPTQPA